MKLRLGTRGSDLAVAQTGWVVRQLEQAHQGLDVEVITIKTSGDRIRDVPLAQVGGKGLFVKEIEAALLQDEIDCAVHSMKDLPGELPTGLTIAAVPRRENPCDVVISRDEPVGLRRGMKVGTCSPRRAALLLATGLDLEVVPLRGNVGTRLAKVQSGEVDATLLAAAGLRRLGLDPPNSQPLGPREFVPAVGQGTLALETREGEWAEIVRAIEDPISRIAADAERAFLTTVDGNCVSPLAAFAEVVGDEVVLDGLIAHPSGRPILREQTRGAVGDAVRLGAELADRLLSAGGRELLDGLEEPA